MERRGFDKKDRKPGGSLSSPCRLLRGSRARHDPRRSAEQPERRHRHVAGGRDHPPLLDEIEFPLGAGQNDDLPSLPGQGGQTAQGRQAAVVVEAAEHIVEDDRAGPRPDRLIQRPGKPLRQPVPGPVRPGQLPVQGLAQPVAQPSDALGQLLGGMPVP